MGVGHDIGTYYKWAVLIPVSMGITVVAVAMLPLVFVYLIEKCSCNHFTTFFFVYSKVIYRDALKIKKNPPRILFHSYEISNWHVIQFSTVISMFIFAVFVSFWSSFLLESTYTCNPTLDCFFRNSTVWVNKKIVEDCKNIDSSVTIVCYQFVLNATKGFSSSVGFLAVAVMYIYVYGYLVLWLMEIVLSPRVASIGAKLCSAIGWTLLIVFPLIVAVVAVVVMYSDKILAEITFKNFDSEVIFVTYWLFFVYTGPLSAVFVSFTFLKPVKAQMHQEYESDRDLRVNLSLSEKENSHSSSSSAVASGTRPLLQGQTSTYASTLA